MTAYLIVPFLGYGTWKEPYLALGISGLWAIYGGIYFLRSSKAKERRSAYVQVDCCNRWVETARGCTCLNQNRRSATRGRRFSSR